MISQRIAKALLITALAAAVAGQYAFTDTRVSRNLGPDNPVRADISDQIAFLKVSGRDGPAVIAAIERSTRSDFNGFFVDLDDASVASVPYQVSQQNVPIRISTTSAKKAEQTCYTFITLSMLQPAADRIVIQGKTTDGGDRATSAGNSEFEITSSSALKLEVSLDPGPSGVPGNCAGEFWVGERRFPIVPLNPIAFQLNAAKRGLFRFSKLQGTDSPIRLASSFEASDVIINRADGNLRSRWSTPKNRASMAVQEFVLNPSSIDLSVVANALWNDSESRHITAWAGQHPGRLLLYGAVDLTLIAVLLRRLRTTGPKPPVKVSAPVGRYVFISYERTDRELVRSIAEGLRDAGVDTRFDDQLRVGGTWPRELEALIDGCFALIVLMTPESRNSNFVGKEIRFAQEIGRPIIPVLIRDTHSLLLVDVQHIDARANNRPIDELLAALQSLGYTDVVHGATAGT
jgi:hypothetical protein